MTRETARRFGDDLPGKQLEVLVFFLSEQSEKYAMMTYFEQKIKNGPAMYSDFLPVLTDWEKDFTKTKSSSAFKKMSKAERFVETTYRALKLDKIVPVNRIVGYAEKVAGNFGSFWKSLKSGSVAEGKSIADAPFAPVWTHRGSDFVNND